MKKISLFVVLGLFVVSFVCGCSDSSDNGATNKKEEKVVLKLSYVTSPESVKGVAAKKFAELIKEKAGGRIDVQVYPSAQLYGDKEELQALMANNVQIIVPSITKLVSMDPSYQFVDLPFLFNDDESVFRFWDGEGGKLLLGKLEDRGIIGLGSWSNAPINIIGNKLIKTPGDLKGMKIRIPAGQVTTDVLSAFGAGGATIPFSEVYTSLQQGVVDAALSSVNNFEKEKFYEVSNKLTLIDMQRLEYIVLTNKQFWNSLPSDLRAVVKEAMQGACDYERSIAKKLNSDSLEVMKKSGVDVYKITMQEREKFSEALKSVYDKWVPVVGSDVVKLAQKANQ